MMHTVNLDIGCGKTPITPESVGADLLYNNINCTNLPFKDNSFDSVTALEIFEHLTWEEQFKTLAEIERVLTDNGQLIISIPNSKGLMKQAQILTWYIRERTTQRLYHNNPLIKGHINLISPDEMVAMLQWHKFNIQERRRVLIYDYIIRATKN